MNARTRCAIIGADPSAFHIFNTIYRNDDRYEIVFFINTDINSPQTKTIKYPPNLSGTLYQQGIPIIKNAQFKSFLKDKDVTKCIFSHYCVTSGNYLNLAAQCLAAGCQVVSHNLDLTKLTPPKPLISFFSDTQFDYFILKKITETYKAMKFKPMCLFFGGATGVSGSPFIIYKDLATFEKNNIEVLGDHKMTICKELLKNDIPIAFIYDCEAFCLAMTQDEDSILIAVGFNMLPCFFRSHLQIYSFDDSTFGDEISQHSSAIIAQQSDIIIYCPLGVPDDLSRFKHQKDGRKFITLPVTYSTGGFNYASGTDQPLKALLVDDPYPANICTAVHSLSEKLAKEHFKVEVIQPPSDTTPTIASIYCEKTEAEWPALIMPDKAPNELEDFIKTIQEFPCDLIISSTQKPLPPIPGKKVIQLKFTLDTSAINETVLELPFSAFVKPRLR